MGASATLHVFFMRRAQESQLRLRQSLRRCSNQNLPSCHRSIHRHPTSTAIDGLQYIPNYVSEQEEAQLLRLVDSGQWFHAIRRRIQFYGPVYYYTKHFLPEVQPERNYEVSPLSTVQFLLDRFERDGIFEMSSSSHAPNQCLVNEYVSNQNIADHVDHAQVFGDTIVGLSLLEPTVMTFSPIAPVQQQGQQEQLNQASKFSILLEPRSLYVFKREARYEWKHGIKSSKRLLKPPVVQQQEHTTLCREYMTGSNENHYLIRDENYRRISLTFRHVNLDLARTLHRQQQEQQSNTTIWTK